MVARAETGDPGGSLIAVGTVGTERGMPRFQPYAASKGALQPLIRSIVAEHSRHGIRANLIQPGFIETDMTADLGDDVKTALLKQIPLGLLGQPDDIASAALYLASPAARYVTGQVLTVDGGMVM